MMAGSVHNREKGTIMIVNTLDDMACFLADAVDEWPSNATEAEYIHFLPDGWDWIDTDGGAVAARRGEQIGPTAIGEDEWIDRKATRATAMLSPRPWKSMLVNNDAWIEDGEGQKIAVFGNFLKNLDRAGDAQLMAAAPEMLRMLATCHVITRQEGYFKYSEQISDLIKKITR